MLGLVLVVLGACGGSGGGAAPPIGTSDYRILVTGLQANGLQVGRQFSIDLEFVSPASGNAVALPDTEEITVSIFEGPGALLGPTTRAGDGTTTLRIDGLILDTLGEYQLEVRGGAADTVVVTDPFTVGQRLQFAFRALPSRLFASRPFVVRAEIVDADTLVPVIPDYPVPVSLTVDGRAPLEQVFNNTSEVLFTGVHANGSVSPARVMLASFGFETAESPPIEVDTVEFRNVRIEEPHLVNGDVFVRADIIAAAVRQPVALDPPLNGVVTVAFANASGVTTGQSVGSAIEVGPLQVDADGVIAVTLGSVEAPGITLQVEFGYALEAVRVGAQAGASRLPGEDMGHAELRWRDGRGAVFTGPSDPVAWQLVADATQRVDAEGSVAFDASGVARIPLRAPQAPGDYTLRFSPAAEPVRIGAVPSLAYNVDFQLVDAPGPFAVLRSGRVGEAYTDDVTFAARDSGLPVTTRFGVLRGELPEGLTLDGATGALSGTPTLEGDHEFDLWARQSDLTAELQPLRCYLPVFRADESDIDAAPPDYSLAGPFAAQVAVTDDSWSFVSSFDQQTYTTTARVWAPPASAGFGLPCVVFHRARSVAHTNYDGLGQHLASHGFVCVSVEDSQSFAGGTGGAPDPIYESTVPEAGVQSAAAFLEAAAARIADRSATLGDALFGRVDPDRFVYAGHGHGGGAVHAAHARFQTTKARGYVYLMPLDLRFFPGTAPPGNPRGTALYPIENELPRAPALVVSAENDLEMVYPLADQLVERSQGPFTHRTVYGGVHSFVTDTGTSDAFNATITRAAQQAEVFAAVTAFVQRWAMSDRTLAGLLTGDQRANSTKVGQQGWRDGANVLVVDDFQDLDTTQNALGGANALSAGSRTEVSVYPPIGALNSIGVRHNLLFLSGVAAATYSTGLGVLDLSAHRRFRCRIGQRTGMGFDWVTIRVRLRDQLGTTAEVTVHDRALQASAFLPDHDPVLAPSRMDRAIDLSVPLASFAGLDLTAVTDLELVFETDASFVTVRQVYCDDLRFD